MKYLYAIFENLETTAVFFFFLFIVSDVRGSMINQYLNFFSMIEGGALKQKIPIEGESTLPAIFKKNNDFRLNNEALCESFTLSAGSEKIMTLLICDFDEVFICPGDSQCTGGGIEASELISKEKFRRISKVSSNRYQVEFYKDRFIYRIQEKNCLVKYPHGCLLKGIGWYDEYTYEFRGVNE